MQVTESIALCVQMDGLPKLAHHKIASMVANMGTTDLLVLRSCSKYWNALCIKEMHTMICCADNLKAAHPFIRSIPQLVKAVIRGNRFRASTVDESTMSAFADKTLVYLSITCNDLDIEAKDRKAIMNVADLGSILQPWVKSLETLVLGDCFLLTNPRPTLLSSGFLADLNNLTTLHLERVSYHSGVRALNLSGCSKLQVVVCVNCQLTSLDLTSCGRMTELDCSGNSLATLDLSSCACLKHLICDTDQSLTTLDMSSCSQLQSLSCRICRLITLDVTACSELLSIGCVFNALSSLDLSGCLNLRYLNCDFNKLTFLDLTACDRLKEVRCSGNQLATIILPDRGRLEKLQCNSNSESLVLLGQGTMSRLECDSSVFKKVTPSLRSQIRTVILGNEVNFELTGFKNLRKLYCSLGRDSSINLTGCSSVDVSFSAKTSNVRILGRGSVKTLAVTGKWFIDNLSGFTALQELHVDVKSISSLNLSECSTVRKLWILNRDEKCDLSSIDLTGCSSLAEIHCSGLNRLTCLNLLHCTGLQAFKCVGSSLVHLDVSCCPLLISIDVSQSSLLETLSYSNHHALLDLEFEECPHLLLSRKGDTSCLIGFV